MIINTGGVYAQARSRGAVRIGPATLYTILGKFEKEHYIREIAVEGRKRTYEITTAGENAYQTEIKRLRRCLNDAVKHFSTIDHTSSPPLTPLSPDWRTT